MKKILFSLILTLGMGVSWGQVTFWSEDFESYANGTGIDGTGNIGDYPGGVSKWTLDVSNATLSGTSDYLETTHSFGSQVMTGRDTDGEAVWLSENIDISGYTDIEISAKFRESGTMESGDYYRIEYQLDGGSWITFATNGEQHDDYGGWDTASQTGLNGNTLKIRITVNCNAGSEYENFDDIVVKGTPVTTNDSDTEVYDTGTQPAAATISSLDDTDNEAVEVFQMEIQDQGSGDGLPTKVTNIRLKPYSTNTADWTDNIQGFVIYDSNLNEYTPASVSITDSAIDLAFNSGDFDIADGGAIDLSFYVYLNTAGIEDGKVLSFMVDADDHGFTADSSGSDFATTFTLGDFNSNDFTIDVEATELQFLQQPTDVAGNVVMSPAVSVAYTDANGNVDIDYDGLGATATLSASGATLAASTTTDGTPVQGVMTFNNIKFVTAGSGVTLTITDNAGITNPSVTSDAFNVTGAPEISVEGNNTEIASGDTTPDTADDTDFGDVNYQDGSSAIHTFTIKNTGNVNLDLTDASPYITITGDTGDFTLDVNPSTPIAANGSTTFDIKFDPTTYGARNAHISIANNDSDENPYEFDIIGNGISTDEVDWGNVQWPETGNIRSGDSFTVYAQVYEPGVTDSSGQGTGISVWIGYSTVDNDPTDSANAGDWTWIAASYNTDQGNNDEYMAEIGSGLSAGTYYYASRFQLNGGPYKYGGYNGGFWDHIYADNTGNKSGQLTIDIIDWCNLQYPENGTQVVGTAFNVYAQVKEDTVTNDGDNPADAGTGIQAWIGYSTVDNDPSDPANAGDWTWVAATYNTDSGDNDEFMVDLSAAINTPGTYYYASRFQINSGPYAYGGYNGGFWSNTYADATGNKSGRLILQAPQEMLVKGNGVEIVSGDNTPSEIDETDFRQVKVNGSSVSRTYTIYNTGDADLNLTGSPIVSISGTNAADFTISSQPVSPVSGGSSTTFTVTFDPSDYGVRIATISIDNNDADENPYTFDIQGTGADYTNCTGIDYIQDFETTPAQPELTYTNTSHIYNSSGISASLYPTGDSYYVSGSNAKYLNNYSAGGTIWFNTVDTRNYTDIEFSIRVASFSGTSGNGADLVDHVEILVSTDDGATWSEELEVTGADSPYNAKWSFDSGTGIAEVAYDGDNTKTTFTPASGGYRTTDGYSTMRITNLPSVEKLKIKIWVKNNSADEYWMLDDAKLIGRKATTWSSGGWTNGVPDEITKLIIDDNYDTTNGNLHACECEVKSGKTLTISDGGNLEIETDIVNKGTILVNNEGSLVQYKPDAVLSGTGTYQLNKTSKPLNNAYDYVYWSSPLNSSTFSLGDIVSNAWGYYKFDPNEANNGANYPGWVALSAADIPVSGFGYAISAPLGTNSGTILTPQFTKNNDTFNNGNITVNILKKGGPDNVGDYNLLGNPYPSAIDFNALVNDPDNASVNGSYYLWTNCAGLNGNHHQAGGYTVYATSGTNVAACDANGGTAQAGQYIATAQGFFIEANTDNSTLTFKNKFRVTGNNDNFLNRPAQNHQVVWLNMTDDTGNFNQIAVGFYPDATTGFDRLFDAHSMSAGNGYALYAKSGDDKLVIDALPDTDIDNAVVPLGVEISAISNLTFSLDHQEGLNDFDIFLYDKDTRNYTNLKNVDYIVNMNEGTYEDRFELVFRSTLSIDDDSLENAILLSQQSGVFNLYSETDKFLIKDITVYDINGRVLFENNGINTHHTLVNLSNLSNGSIVLFRIITSDNQTLIKKAIKLK